jgi:hypothetical protein
MKVLIDINEDLFNRICEVNQSSSLSSFILVAIENQIYLEKEQNSDPPEFNYKFKKNPRMKLKKEQNSKKPNEVMEYLDFLKKHIDYEKIHVLSLKGPIKDGYIWGQYNKFFALKFAVRYLAYLQSQNNFLPVKISDYHDRCSKAASQLKQLLLQSDDKAGRVWGEGFSAGLPDSEEKSRSRFIKHFIGYLDTKGTPVGALPDIGFIVIVNDKVGLTSYGLAFAKCPNPILDDDPFATSLFNQEERQYLIGHIKTNIPLEWGGMAQVLQWIDTDRIDTPDSLNIKFATLGKDWTPKMANTYRTGMLARMYDLGLICREKNGIKVRYKVTDTAKTMGGSE